MVQNGGFTVEVTRLSADRCLAQITVGPGIEVHRATVYSDDVEGVFPYETKFEAAVAQLMWMKLGEVLSYLMLDKPSEV